MKEHEKFEAMLSKSDMQLLRERLDEAEQKIENLELKEESDRDFIKMNINNWESHNLRIGELFGKIDVISISSLNNHNKIQELEERCDKYERSNLQNFEEIKQLKEKIEKLEKQMPDSFSKWENEFEQRLSTLEFRNLSWIVDPELVKRIEELEKDFANICENRSIPDSWCKHLEERHKELRENLEYKLERIETSGKYNHSNLLDACRRIVSLEDLKNKLVTAQLNVNNSLSNKLTELKDNNEQMCKKLIAALGGRV